MTANGESAEGRRLASEVLELLDSVGDPADLTGSELVQFDMRRNEILEDVEPIARRLAELVLSREHNES